MRRQRARSNPPLLIFSNPRGGRIVSHDVIEIKYRHAEDGRLYRHKFARDQVEIIGNGRSHRCVLRRKDGRPILREYNV